MDSRTPIRSEPSQPLSSVCAELRAPKPIVLKPHSVVIDAPRELIFQMLTAFRRGRIQGDDLESSKLVSEDGDAKIVEFREKVGPFSYTMLEEVTLYPPQRVAFKGLKGPLHFSEEEFTLDEIADGRTIMTHNGTFILNTRPIFGWLGGVTYVRPMFHSAIRKRLALIKEAAEARAARSRVFKRAK